MPKAEQTPKSFLQAHRDEASDEVYGIAELARELETTTRAIRFYESKGLLSPKRVGQTRVYGRRERARLVLILRGKALGIKLRDLKQYLDLYGEHGEGRRKQLEHVIARTGEVIDQLERKRRSLDTTLEEVKMIRRESQKKLRALGDE